jgi:hypothetical protein
MATTRPYLAGNDIKLEYGVPQIACFKWLEGRSVPSQFGERAMFTAIDSRKLFVDGEDASDIERGMRGLGIRPGEDFVRLTKIKHPRGGGHSIRVERAHDESDTRQPEPRRDTPPSKIEAQLEKSVELAREHGAAAFQRPPARVSPEPPPAAAAGPASNNSDHTGRAHQLKGSFLAAIDAITEAQRYADAQGLKVTFTSEDVRATAISAFIQAEKAAMGVRY